MRKVAIILAGALCLGAAPTALAVPSAKDKRLAKHYQKLGQKYYGKQRYKQAVHALRNAYRLWPRREFLFNIALCYFELGDKVKVAIELRKFLRGATAKQRRSIPGALMKVLKRVGFLHVKAKRQSQAIYVDGNERGNGKVEIVVEPGDHAIEVKEGGRTIIHKLVNVKPGGKTLVDLRPKPRPPPRRVVTTPPPARRGVTPPPRRTAGNEPGEKKPTRRQGLHYGIFIGVASAAVLFAAIAAGTSVKTRDLWRKFDANPTHSTRREGDKFQNITNAMWGLTGAAAVTATVLAFFTRWKSAEKSEPAAVTVDPSAYPVGASLKMRW